ncbi:unnamed protein product [Heligmosomoides polygyrus]|uniref:Autophagy-related protein 5 n=1 Tax=Heligmosomoides polygyrus TaxID=6339 RepID=A0A183F2V2_HELPZ|nr:unnamed protein product [Heligmosomoides polygyrus]
MERCPANTVGEALSLASWAVNVAQLAKLIRGYLFPMGCGVVEEENLLEALRPNECESPVHLFYFVHPGHSRAFGKQLQV